jgi:hypothetical protein
VLAEVTIVTLSSNSHGLAWWWRLGTLECTPLNVLGSNSTGTTSVLGYSIQSETLILNGPPATGRLYWCPQISWSLGWILYLQKKKPKFNESNLQFPKVHESQIFLSISNVRDSWRIANPSQKFKYQFTSRIACQLTFISFMLWECSFSLLFILFLQYFVW